MMIPTKIKVISEVTRKEIIEHFKTKRLLVISIIFTIVFLIIAVYGGYLLSTSSPDAPAYEGGANNVLGLVLLFTGIFPPILAIALSYDSIVGERTRRSLHLIVSKPIDRSSIFIGKFLGSFLSIAIVYLIVTTIGYLVVIAISGKIPSIDDFGRAYAAIGIIIFSAACWVLFVMLFSTSFKTITSTIIFSVIFWIFILNLLSQSGLIYYMVTTSSADEPITIDITIVENSYLYFNPHRIDNPISEVDINLRDETGRSVEPAQTSGKEALPLYSLATLKPGNYTWDARYQKDTYSNKEKIAQGSFYFGTDFLPVIFISSLEDDGHYNDIGLNIRGLSLESNAHFNITIRSKKDNRIIDMEPDWKGVYILKDTKEGDYRVTVSKDNIIYLDATIHSYGEKKSREQVFFFTGEEIEYPDYVKATYALNPDNAASVYSQVLSDESSSMDILTIQEGLMALTLLFIFIFLLGIFIFSRIELI